MVKEPTTLVTVEDIARAYDFGPSHPLRPERVLLTYQHVRNLGLDRDDALTLEPARSATVEEIAAVHDQAFIDTVRAIDNGDEPPGAGARYGLGTVDDPIFPGMHDASAAVCGASVVAAEQVV